MAKASHYKVLAMLLAGFNSLKAFNVFWKFRSNSSECFKEEELIKQVQEQPLLCYQGVHNSSSPVTTRECVKNIQILNKKIEEIDFNNVPMCKTDKEIICCIHSYQHKFDMNYLKAFQQYVKSSYCEYILKVGTTFLSNYYQPVGRCAFPFIYKNKTYNKCTVFTDDSCLRWCATLVDANNVYIENSGLWAYCDNTCSVNYDETCHDKNKIPRFQTEFFLESTVVQASTKHAELRTQPHLLRAKMEDLVKSLLCIILEIAPFPLITEVFGTQHALPRMTQCAGFGAQ